MSTVSNVIFQDRFIVIVNNMLLLIFNLIFLYFDRSPKVVRQQLHISYVLQCLTTFSVEFVQVLIFRFIYSHQRNKTIEITL